MYTYRKGDCLQPCIDVIHIILKSAAVLVDLPGAHSVCSLINVEIEALAGNRLM